MRIDAPPPPETSSVLNSVVSDFDKHEGASHNFATESDVADRVRLVSLARGGGGLTDI